MVKRQERVGEKVGRNAAPPRSPQLEAHKPGSRVELSSKLGMAMKKQMMHEQKQNTLFQ